MIPILSFAEAPYLFRSWHSVLHVSICAAIAYLALFLFIRISGKRSLAKLNAFDFVVTVTLGSSLSSMMLAQVPLVDGAVAVSIMVGLQYLLAKAARTSKAMDKLINSNPTLLFYNGRIIPEAISHEFITESEVFAAIRTAGILRMDDVQAVVMELNGEITVVRKAGGEGETSLDPLDMPKKN